jgi:hypothetical protein
MNKSRKKFLVIIILLVTLAIMTVLYLKMRNTVKENLNHTVLKNKVPEEKNYSSDTNQVKIEVDESTITPTSISIIITNNKENDLSYGENFKIQKKINGKWKDLDYASDKLYWKALAYKTKGNSQTTNRLDIEYYYGKLDNGTYRVVKPINGDLVNIYSNEFEIE